jgi:uncharacterized surface protein with fasciclin (FAS1) repeats
LKGPGPYTLFAPTDAAFEKLPPGSQTETTASISPPFLFNYFAANYIYIICSSNIPLLFCGDRHSGGLAAEG